MYITDIKVSHILIRSSWHFSGHYPSLKPHILFYSNGLAIWHSFPDITHTEVNDGLKSAILNLTEFTFFKAYGSLPETADFVLE